MSIGTATPEAVIRPTDLAALKGHGGILRVLPAWIASGVVHVLFLIFFLLLTWNAPVRSNTENSSSPDGNVEDAALPIDNLTNPDIGPESSSDATNYAVKTFDKLSVPGDPDPQASIGFPGAALGPAVTIPPPKGFRPGQGGGLFDPTKPGDANPFGQPGGYRNGVFVPYIFQGRGGSTSEFALKVGGTDESEAAVGLGLQWLAIHQSSNGSWSLDKFHQHAHEIGGGPSSKEFRCDCGGQGMSNDIAGTAFGLLPFLGAGQTHQAPKEKTAVDYHKAVRAGIDFLLTRQKSDGDFGGGMYAQGLATIALCECYALTADAKLKPAAQRAIDFIKNAQHEAGGWRYKPKEAGDTSVVGWQVMALKSGQLAGLNVPKETLDGAGKFLDSVMTSDGSGYKYTEGTPVSPTITAVGLLCRQYLGWNYKNPKLGAGVNTLKNSPPGALNSIYYYYYATQVMHHMQGDVWEAWNPKMRDSLIAKQDKGTDAKHAHQKGSWSPVNDAHGAQGGRFMVTSLSILTLEVYYRHLPLYRRDLGVMKEMEGKP